MTQHHRDRQDFRIVSAIEFGHPIIEDDGKADTSFVTVTMVTRGLDETIDKRSPTYAIERTLCLSMLAGISRGLMSAVQQDMTINTVGIVDPRMPSE